MNDIDKEIFYEKLHKYLPDEDDYSLFDDMVVIILDATDYEGKSKLKALYNGEELQIYTDKPVNYWCDKLSDENCTKEVKISGARYGYGRRDIFYCLIKEAKAVSAMESIPLRCTSEFLLGDLLHDLAFRKLYELMPGLFANVLSELLHFMYLSGIIKHNTLKNMISHLGLNTEWCALLPNADGTYRLYRRGWVEEDVFKLEDLHKYIVNQLLRDKKLSGQLNEYKKNHSITPYEKEYDTMIYMLNQYHVPKSFRKSYNILRELDLVAVTDTDIYYMETVESSFSLRKVPYDKTWMREINIKKSNTMAKGLDVTWTIYCEKDKGIYCKYKKIDAYMRYDTDRNEITNTYGHKLLKVGDDGQIYSIDREGTLYYQEYGEKMKKINLKAGEEWAFNEHDELVIYSISMNVDAFTPYVIKNGIVIGECNSKFLESEMWKRLISSTQNPYFVITRGFTIRRALCYEELLQTPEFCPKAMLDRIDYLMEKRYLTKKGSYPLRSLLKLLVRKGAAEDENICDLLYRLCLMDKYCKKQVERSCFISKRFFQIVNKLARRDDFMSLLRTNPKELFKEYIVWTEKEHNAAFEKKGDLL